MSVSHAFLRPTELARLGLRMVPITLYYRVSHLDSGDIVIDVWGHRTLGFLHGHLGRITRSGADR